MKSLSEKRRTDKQERRKRSSKAASLIFSGLLLLIFLCGIACTGKEAGQPGSYDPDSAGYFSKDYRKGRKEIKVTGESTKSAVETTATPEETTMALRAITDYLNAVMLGGTELNWALSSVRFRDEVLNEYAAEDSTMEAFVKFLNEGIAHEKIVTYTIAESVIEPERGTVLIRLQKEKLDRKEYEEARNFYLVREVDGWKVDGGF